jgi:hypothetical protein
VCARKTRVGVMHAAARKVMEGLKILFNSLRKVMYSLRAFVHQHTIATSSTTAGNIASVDHRSLPVATDGEARHKPCCVTHRPRIPPHCICTPLWLHCALPSSMSAAGHMRKKGAQNHALMGCAAGTTTMIGLRSNLSVALCRQLSSWPRTNFTATSISHCNNCTILITARLDVANSKHKGTSAMSLVPY